MAPNPSLEPHASVSKLTPENLHIHDQDPSHQEHDHRYAQQLVERERYQDWRKAMHQHLHSQCPDLSPCRSPRRHSSAPSTPSSHAEVPTADTPSCTPRCLVDHDATANSTLDRLLQPARASTVGPEVRFAILDGVDSTFTYLEKEFMEDVDAAAGDMESEAKRMDAAVRATTDVLRKKMRRQNRARVKTEKRLRLAKVGGGSWKVEGSDPWSSQQ